MYARQQHVSAVSAPQTRSHHRRMPVTLGSTSTALQQALDKGGDLNRPRQTHVSATSATGSSTSSLKTQGLSPFEG